MGFTRRLQPYCIIVLYCIVMYCIALHCIVLYCIGYRLSRFSSTTHGLESVCACACTIAFNSFPTPPWASEATQVNQCKSRIRIYTYKDPKVAGWRLDWLVYVDICVSQDLHLCGQTKLQENDSLVTWQSATVTIAQQHVKNVENKHARSVIL